MIRSITLFCLALLFQAASAQSNTKAILVWSIFNGEHNVISSSLIGEQWSAPQVIYSSDNLIVTPTLVKLADQRTLAVWSELQGSKTVILESILDEQTKEWSKAKPLVDDGAENLNPNLINDGRGTLWFFWSGNDGGLDDIFYKSRKLGESEWSGKQQLNPANDVPDYKPIAELNDDGDILVRWQTYDFLTGQYIEASEVIITEPADQLFLSKSQADLELSDIILPEYLPDDTSITLLFPNNQAAQAIRLD